MGKLNDLFKRIKGLLGRNKKLPEGKADNYISVEMPEIKEEPKMTEHENFVSSLKEQAQTFDLTHMPTEEAIAKALEEKGLNAEIAKNPEFQKQMAKIFSPIFEHNSMPNEQMAENLRKAIANKQYGNYSFSITTDGNFEFKEVRKDDLLYAPKANNTLFMADKTGNLNVISTSEFESLDENKRVVFNTKNQSTFNKDGLEMKKINASVERTYQPANSALPIVKDNYETIIRNDDLLTANQYIFDTTDRNFRVNFSSMIDSAPFPEIVR